jgi:hypothetical protein
VVEIRGNGVTVLLVSYVNGMYVVKLGEWTHQPLLSFEAKLNLSRPFWRGEEVQQFIVIVISKSK